MRYMAETKREIERKYVFPDGAGPGGAGRLPALTGVREGAVVVAAGATELDATYYDTQDLRLARSGITLRRREGGGDAGWHLKLPVTRGVRDEVRTPLSGALPRDLTGLLRATLRGAEPVPVVRLRTARDITVLRDADGTPLVELALDAVHAERLGVRPGDRVHVLAWTEVEAELADGADPAVLDNVDKKLRKAGLVPAPYGSKLARALGATAEDGGPGASREAGVPRTAGGHVLAYLGAQAAALVALDPAVRRELPDAVHQMRVAIRRLRSALRSYGAVLDRSVTQPVADELKWLGGELGVDRDSEVLTERLAGRVAAVPDTLLLGPVEARLRIWSTGSRTGSRDVTLAVLDSERYAALLDSLDALLADPPLRKKAGAAPAGALSKAVLKDYARLAGRTEHALALPAGRERDLALHDARKAAKRARYTAEAARPALGGAAKRLAKRMKAVQKVLGEHQDAVVARGVLRDLAVQAHAAGESAFTWGLLYSGENERALRCERELPAVWAASSRPRWHKELGG
jgi:CHAD domain-containing protein